MLDVESVSDYVEKIVAAGGEVVTPKTAIPGLGYVGYCKDVAGNAFGLFEGDEGVA